MKTIKTLLAVGVLAAAGAANATVWNINATGSRNYHDSGDLSVVYAGTWDDVANAGSWVGTAGITSPFALSGTYNQTFTMNEATGAGVIQPLTGCTDSASGAVCAGFSGVFVGAVRNNSSAFDQYAAIKPTATGTAFVPADGGNYVWSFYVKDPSKATVDAEGNTSDYWTKYDLNVTLHSQAPAVPVPAAAWLFGSGILGLAGAARRRRAAAAA